MGHTACTEPQCLYMGALYLYLKLTGLQGQGSGNLLVSEFKEIKILLLISSVRTIVTILLLT